MDFTKYELSDELRATLQKDYNADVAGLKSKNNDLIDREKAAKLELDQYKLDAEQEKHTAAKELAEKNGSIAEYKAALDNEKEQMTLLKHEFQQTEEKRLIESAVNEFSTLIVDDPAGRMYMKTLFQQGIEVKDGVVVSKDVTISIEEYEASLVSDKSNAPYIKANVGSGAGAAGSDGGVNPVKSPKDMNEAERFKFKQENPEAFKQAFKL